MNSSPAPQPVIEFRSVSFRLDETPPILDCLNLSVHRGETLILLGRSGAGKTTILKLVNRLLVPTSGEVRVEGADVSKLDLIRLRRGIGYCIQEVGLFPHLSVAANVGLLPKLEGWPPERICSRVDELLRLVGLPGEFGSRYPHELSGGQRQRVGLARALATDPPILLMDEPFGALDAITRMEVQREFQRLQQRLAKTVLFVTHNLSAALQLGTRIALLEHGLLVGVYTPDSFLRDPHPLLRSYRSAFEARNQGLETGTR
ncbi:MAG: ATP-binding cassette domain-containing protein [Acidobacteriota bacterium]